ncbi:MAG: hypothetical protein KGQ54_05090 [Verrucomicrobia bacterium]|nr:hypothetical protein [Verrucomicrobiota bacterium]
MELLPWNFLWGIGFCGLLVLFLILGGAFIVREQTIPIIEVFGKFYATKTAGIPLKFPFPIATIAGRINLPLQGKGIALQRKAIAEGFQKAVQGLKTSMPHMDKAKIVARLFLQQTNLTRFETPPQNPALSF